MKLLDFNLNLKTLSFFAKIRVFVSFFLKSEFKLEKFEWNFKKTRKIWVKYKKKLEKFEWNFEKNSKNLSINLILEKKLTNTRILGKKLKVFKFKLKSSNSTQISVYLCSNALRLYLVFCFSIWHFRTHNFEFVRNLSFVYGSFLRIFANIYK